MNYSARYIIGIFLVVMGLGFFFDINIWRFFWPAVLILLGLKMLTGTEEKKYTSRKETTESDEDVVDYSIVFNELNKKLVSQNFRGGKVDLIFGGGTLDLRETVIPEGKTADLEVTTIFGGVKVLVPETWKVNASLSGILGGFENKTIYQPKKGEEAGRLNIRGTAIFGGGEVTNGE